MPQDTQVVIVGAGPVGCVSALILSWAGISVRILESEPELIKDLRASTFHPPTLDMLDELDLSAKLVAEGLITPSIQFRDMDNGVIAEFDHALIKEETAHPYRLQCEQFKLTRHSAEMMKGYPDTAISFSSRVTEIDQDDTNVIVTFRTPDGPQSCTCDYLIGCDGSRSSVRKICNIGFPGFTYPEQFVTASAIEPIDEIVPGMGHVVYVAHPTEWGAIIHAPEFWRFLFPISMEVTEEEAFDEDYLQTRLKRFAPYEGDYTIDHRTIYGVNQRVVENYRQGRVLLAGDAAHVNNPLGGMGMNGGIHDGLNVSKKLVSILNDGAGDELLDLYDRQRRPIANEYVQAQTIRNKNNLEKKDPAVRKQRQDEMRAVAADPEKAKAFLLQTSMFNGVRRSEAIE